VETAVAYLKKGKIVAFPTETYYGLAVDPENRVAVERLFKVKKRVSEKPLLLLIHTREQLESLVKEIPPEFVPLMEKYWPGALTLVFPAGPLVDTGVTGGTKTIGIRISPHPVAQRLVQGFGKPITATSANISGLPPASAPDEILAMFGDGVDYILDGGIVTGGLSSTVLAVIQDRIAILRHGQIALQKEELEGSLESGRAGLTERGNSSN